MGPARHAWIVIAAVALNGCTNAHEAAPDATSLDAGTDAPRSDTGTDAWRPDAATVPANDAAPTPDAFDPPDGSPYDPTWVLLRDAPGGCDIEIAAHPERLSWPTGYVGAAFRIAGRDYVALAPTLSDTTYGYRGLVELDGSVGVAFRTRTRPTGPDCWIDDVAVHDTDVGFHVGDCAPCGLFGTWTSRIYRARFDDVAATQRVVGRYEIFLGTDTPPEPRLALGADSASAVDLDSQVQVALADGTVRVVGQAWDRTIHLGDDVLFSGGSPQRLMRSQHGADATALTDERGRDVTWFGSDGTTHAWIVGSDLYTGSYDGALHGTLVRALDPSWGTPVVGGGYFVRTERESTPSRVVSAVYRLSDGLRARIDASAAPLLVTSDEIVLAPAAYPASVSSLPRIDPRTLTFR